eukprot:Em0376g7a
MKRIENVFLKGIKAWISMLLPNLRLKCEADMKISFSIQSAMAAIEVPVIDKEAQNKASFVSIPVDILSTIPTTIRDVLKCERRYTSMDARKLLVPLADVPQAYVASLLKISNNYVLHLLFQAKVDRLYLTCGVKLQEYCETHSRVPSDSVTFAVSFIYSDDSITRLAWEAKKQTPNRDPKWKELKNVYAMRSLVLKQDVATMYKGLRHVALVKLHEDPTRLEEIADVLLTVHQSKGFREGGDSYYGKKGMLWWGAGVYVKPDTGQDDRSPESLEENHVEIDFTTEVLRLQQPLEMMNTGNVVLDDNGEEDSEYEKEDGVCESEDNGEECGEECMEGVGGVEEDDGMKDDDKEDSEKEGEDDGEEECAEGVGDVEEDDGMKDDDKEDSEKEGEDDGEEECAEGVGDVEEDDGKHICSGRMESRDALTNAMQHADKLLVSMDFTVDGAIAQASHIFETRYTTFEPNFHAGWAHTRKSMHPDLTARVISIIHDCWKAGETKDLGKVKISADGVFSRLEELQLQHAIRLSELPLAGKIRAVYQSIGQKPRYKHLLARSMEGTKRRDQVVQARRSPG